MADEKRVVFRVVKGGLKNESYILPLEHLLVPQTTVFGTILMNIERKVFKIF